MDRFLALWLPTFTIDRVIQGQGNTAANEKSPLAVTTQQKGRHVLLAVDHAAAAAGLCPRRSLADARAQVPTLRVVAEDPAADTERLTQLADWCTRYSPWVSPCAAAAGEAGLLIDVAGCAHLFGGETGLLRDLVDRLSRFGHAGRAAIAETPGAAWAVARIGGGLGTPGWQAPAAGPDDAVVPDGTVGTVLARLSIVGLRLEPAAVEGLNRLGLRSIGDLMTLPPGALAARFGEAAADRLAQALGSRAEPISPRQPVPPHTARLAFAEPIAATDDVTAALDRLLVRLCADLERAQAGARRLELALYRVDGAVQRIAIGTVRPVRRPDHLRRLFAEHLDRIDAGFGIEVMVLAARRVDPLLPAQSGLDLQRDQAGAAVSSTVAADLIDRLANRLGSRSVACPRPHPRHAPEMGVDWVSAASSGPPARAVSALEAWPDGATRPVRLLATPREVSVMAPVPDDPPVLFRWAGRVRRVVRADGPERIAPPWWVGAETAPEWGRETRDYYRVEDETGRRYWLFRAGLYRPDVQPRWYLHGLFA